MKLRSSFCGEDEKFYQGEEMLTRGLKVGVKSYHLQRGGWRQVRLYGGERNSKGTISFSVVKKIAVDNWTRRTRDKKGPIIREPVFIAWSQRSRR